MSLRRIRIQRLIFLVCLVVVFIIATSMLLPRVSHAGAIGSVTSKQEVLVPLQNVPLIPRLREVQPELQERHLVMKRIRDHKNDESVADKGQEEGVQQTHNKREQDDRYNNLKANLALVGSNKAKKFSRPSTINGHPYPKLNERGNFIPIRRYVHLDLKGGAFKPAFFTEIFFFLNKIGATGIVLEWEDMFPYQGRLKEAVNGNAYSMEEVEQILKSAKSHRLEVIPLVQTFGHLEWILKLEKFAHLREDERYPQVICFPSSEAWSLLTGMIDQVAEAHKKVGVPFFHIGADEAFQIGVCNASIMEMERQGSKERLMLWHIAKVSKYVKVKHQTTVLAWHDMIAQAPSIDIEQYKLAEVLEPIIWSYAENLDFYLPESTWFGLEAFPRVWGSSAWKGADGPHQYRSNPIHYVNNHQGWTKQMTDHYKTGPIIQGLIMSGWSRYDHMAALAELLPVGIPSLALSMETILSGDYKQDTFPQTAEIFDCRISTEMGFTYGCKFPASKIYEYVNQFSELNRTIFEYKNNDFELNGWMSRVADKYQHSSAWYIQKIVPLLRYHLEDLEKLETKLRLEMDKIYFAETVDEFVETYMGEAFEWIRSKIKSAESIMQKKFFPKRPFVKKLREL